MKMVPRRACSTAERLARRHAIPCDVNDIYAGRPAFSPPHSIASLHENIGMKRDAGP
ncbi:bsl2713 [Bradyrhizobium diazoefficiens USDA 110]|uniref:Bsl2713 protein n=1 Tax=Bradyrhizobium diazoefficiens (strain JCM 10833 / BCRC 13528 / IAM 13628 / NBRC 14792 / USDA 110) TaxID=224911 RepID=Q89RP9_BRADU|nr:hypothetical protein Bdiaspc4_14025 [Bradyrhizobium diazoefficiens]BAC47978.1 bsl2713 [Bradyrhizobium diazoefficiens USDA 110]